MNKLNSLMENKVLLAYHYHFLLVTKRLGSGVMYYICCINKHLCLKQVLQ